MRSAEGQRGSQLGCNHRYPLLVFTAPNGRKRAQCLGCKGLGPEGKDAEQARQGLLGAPTGQGPLGKWAPASLLRPSASLALYGGPLSCP